MDISNHKRIYNNIIKNMYFWTFIILSLSFLFFFLIFFSSNFNQNKKQKGWSYTCCFWALTHVSEILKIRNKVWANNKVASRYMVRHRAREPLGLIFSIPTLLYRCVMGHVYADKGLQMANRGLVTRQHRTLSDPISYHQYQHMFVVMHQ